jgi:hypothetical protein
MEFLYDARANPAGVNELLDTGIPHAHEREFSRGKKGVGRHQEQNDKHPEQHESNHGLLILTLQRGNALVLWT